MRLLITSLFLIFCFGSYAQSILHFTRTSGWDHNTRDQSFALFTDIANEIGATVVDDATGDQFTDLSNLLQFDVIVFSNTSGDAILTTEQQQHFETFIANGGSVMGIHAASDTYRHSTANGNATGTWDYYAELMGASVQENPNHVAGTPEYAMQHMLPHASTANVPDPWVKNEEYYYWEGGYFGPDNSVVLMVEETVGPNGLVNSYDAARAMSWYRQLPGGRLFYTALGHAPSNFESDATFRTHITDALLWLLDGTTAISNVHLPAVSFYPNPANEWLNVSCTTEQFGSLITVTDAIWRVVLEQRVEGSTNTVHTHDLLPGCYLLAIGTGTGTPLLIAR